MLPGVLAQWPTQRHLCWNDWTTGKRDPLGILKKAHYIRKHIGLLIALHFLIVFFSFLRIFVLTFGATPEFGTCRPAPAAGLLAFRSARRIITPAFRTLPRGGRDGVQAQGDPRP